MKDFTEFLMEYWILFAALVLCMLTAGVTFAYKWIVELHSKTQQDDTKKIIILKAFIDKYGDSILIYNPIRIISLFVCAYLVYVFESTLIFLVAVLICIVLQVCILVKKFKQRRAKRDVSD